MADAHRGTCFCGAVEIAVTGEPLEMGYCHCDSCRAYSGGPFKAYILWRTGDVRVTKGAALIGRFNKTGMSERQFCTRCGGHVIAAHPALGLTDAAPGMTPGVPFEPTVHLHYGEAVMPVRDGLRKLKDFPAEAGGSGETVPE